MKPMKHVIIALALTMALLTIFASIQGIQAEAATVSIDPSTKQVTNAYVGKSIKVNINVNDVGGLWSWCVSNLTFNSNVLNLTDIDEGPFLKKGGQTLFIWPSSSSKIQEGIVPEISTTLLVNNSVSGSGVIATLNFVVVSAGTSQIMLNNTKLLTPYELNSNPNTVTGVYQQIDSSSINGTLTIDELVDPPANELGNGFDVYLLAVIVVVITGLVLVSAFIVRKRK